jgi:hypothetical protein
MAHAKRSYAQIKAIESRYKQELLKSNSMLDESSGIYFLTRTDEAGIKYAYVGQAKHILTRLAQHMMGHEQHIDLSLKKHGLVSVDNPYGWLITAKSFNESTLDEKERYYIKAMADAGYQLRNKTAGGQDSGKTQIDEYKPHKGYYDGIAQGRKAMARELKHIIDVHLTVELKPEKAHNVTSHKMRARFDELLREGE